MIIKTTLVFLLLLLMLTLFVTEANSAVKREVMSGTVTQVYVDDFEGGESALETTLTSPSGKLRIDSSGASPVRRLLPGSKVVISAERKGRVLRQVRLIKASNPDQQVSPTAFSGTRSVLAIVGSGRDPADVTKALFSTSEPSAKRMLQWQSAGKQTITGDVTSQTFPTISGTGCLYREAGEKLHAAAVTAGYKPDDYDHVIYVLPTDFECSAEGARASLGNINNPGKGEVWIFKTGLVAHAIAHELGHNLGLQHSRSIDCDRYLSSGSYNWSPFPPIQPGARACIISEYGDFNDYMGNRATSLNTRNLELIGARSTDSTLVANAPGTYSLGDTFNLSAAVREIRIPWDVEPGGRTVGYLSIEARRSWLTGLVWVFDIGSCNIACAETRMKNGVSVRLVRVSGGSGKPIDITGSDILTYRSSSDGYASAASQIWPAGATIKDPERGLQVRVVSASPSGASIAVDQLPDTRDTQAPSIPQDLAAWQRDDNPKSVTLSWRKANDNFAVVGYRIIANGSQVAEIQESADTSSSQMEATIPFRPIARKGTYSVLAFDAAGNFSEPSLAQTVIDRYLPSINVTKLRWKQNRKKKIVTASFSRSTGVFKLLAQQEGGKKKRRSSSCKMKRSAAKCTIRLARGNWSVTLNGTKANYKPFIRYRFFKF